jgi:hypothetical protein
MTNFEARKIIWAVVSNIFMDEDSTTFVWIFSPEDMDEANRMPDGISNYGCIGVAKGVDV